MIKRRWTFSKKFLIFDAPDGRAREIMNQGIYILKLPFTRVFHNYVLTMLQQKNVEPENFGYLKCWYFCNDRNGNFYMISIDYATKQCKYVSYKRPDIFHLIHHLTIVETCL
jgi:hypothetical protein